jgi:pyridoxine 5-phosphate synthase
MAATTEMVSIACEVKPEMATLVPEKRQEVTTEGGLDISAAHDRISEAVDKLKNAGIKVSVFIEPQPENVDLALELGADIIEIHTGKYSLVKSNAEKIIELEKIRQTALLAKELAIGVNAGHGLNYINIIPIANINDIDEVSIGHSIIARAVFTGLHQAVTDMLTIIRRVRP